jgi:hypothetical protein
MIPTLVLALLPLLAVAVGLFGFRNAYSAFFLFQGIACLAVPLADLRLAQRKSWGGIRSVVGLRFDRRSLFLGVFWGFVFLAAIVLFFAAFRGALVRPHRIEALLEAWHVRRSHPWGLVLFMTLSNPILEEAYWRGYLLGRFRRHFEGRAAVLLSSGFYASYHLLTTSTLFGLRAGAALTAVVFLAGVFWARWRIRSRSVVGPMISHGLADAAVMSVYLAFVRGGVPPP